MVLHQDVLPRYGSYRGKGEALWKSLYETSGDLVAWCDADVREWHPRFAYGTLGPLLAEPRIGYVKGYYERPIVEGGAPQGGRRRARHGARRAAAHQPLLPRAVGHDPAARRGVRRPPRAPGGHPLLHRLRGRDGPPHRPLGAPWPGRPGPGRPGATGPPQPGAGGPLAHELHHPPGGHEAPRGAASGAALRRAGLDHEAAALLARATCPSRSSTWPTRSARRCCGYRSTWPAARPRPPPDRPRPAEQPPCACSSRPTRSRARSPASPWPAPWPTGGGARGRTTTCTSCPSRTAARARSTRSSRRAAGRPCRPPRRIRSGDRWRRGSCATTPALAEAVVELAAASGLSLVAPEDRDALAASTFGTGQVLAAAIGLGCREVAPGGRRVGHDRRRGRPADRARGALP